MDDPIVHVVLDASVVAAWLLPKSTKSEPLRDRSAQLIEARIKHNWPSIRLYIPGIAAAETQAVLDKYRYCTWSGPVKKDPSVQASKREYQAAGKKFRDLVNSRRIERLDHPADHVIATQLISPINAKHQIRRRRKSGASSVSNKMIPQPMGAADCLIIGSAVSLGMTIGSQNVVIATGDTRLADVVKRLRKLSLDKVGDLGFQEVAARLGTSWSSSLYPRGINLKAASDQSLSSAFQGWPLPTCSWTAFQSGSVISISKRDALIGIYKEYLEQTGIGVDNLPYSEQIDAIRIEMVKRTSLLMTNEQIYRHLSLWRKKGLFKVV